MASGAPVGSGPYLAFDTSGTEGSVAVGSRSGDGGVGILASLTIEERREQASLLVPTIDAALRAAGLARSDLAGIVVGEGPGSFTGVRVAAATAKGLARAIAVPVWAVSSLAAAALAYDASAVRYVLFDARADRIYGACYGVGGAELQELVAPHGGTLRDALAADVPAGSVFVGDGALRHRALIEGAGYPVEPGPAERSLGEGLLRFLALRPSAVAVTEPSSWEPKYVRTWIAEPQWPA